MFLNFFVIKYYFRFYFIFYVKIATPLPPLKVTSLFLTNSPLWSPVKPPLFENLVRGSTQIDVHTSIFNMPHQAFFKIKSAYVIHKFLPANIFGNFLFDFPSFIITTLTLEIHGFKPLQYTCECSHWYKPWKSTKLEIFLICKTLTLCTNWHFNITHKTFKPNKMHRAWQF